MSDEAWQSERVRRMLAWWKPRRNVKAACDCLAMHAWLQMRRLESVVLCRQLPNNRINPTVNSGLRPPLQAGYAERWPSCGASGQLACVVAVVRLLVVRPGEWSQCPHWA